MRIIPDIGIHCIPFKALSAVILLVACGSWGAVRAARPLSIARAPEAQRSCDLPKVCAWPGTEPGLEARVVSPNSGPTKTRGGLFSLGLSAFPPHISLHPCNLPKRQVSRRSALLIARMGSPRSPGVVPLNPPCVFPAEQHTGLPGPASGLGAPA